MKKISSNWTVFYKYGFPTIWLGVLLMIFGTSSLAAYHANKFYWENLLPMVMMVIVGLVIMKFTIFGLVNEVYDTGNSLLVKTKGQEIKISYVDIVNINQTIMMNPQRATVMLYRSNILLGKQFSFIPVKSKSFFGAFTANKEITELTYKIDEYKRSQVKQ